MGPFGSLGLQGSPLQGRPMQGRPINPIMLPHDPTTPPFLLLLHELRATFRMDIAICIGILPWSLLRSFRVYADPKSTSNTDKASKQQYSFEVEVSHILTVACISFRRVASWLPSALSLPLKGRLMARLLVEPNHSPL